MSKTFGTGSGTTGTSTARSTCAIEMRLSDADAAQAAAGSATIQSFQIDAVTGLDSAASASPLGTGYLVRGRAGRSTTAPLTYPLDIASSADACAVIRVGADGVVTIWINDAFDSPSASSASDPSTSSGTADCPVAADAESLRSAGRLAIFPLSQSARVSGVNSLPPTIDFPAAGTVTVNGSLLVLSVSGNVIIGSGTGIVMRTSISQWTRVPHPFAGDARSDLSAFMLYGTQIMSVAAATRSVSVVAPANGRRNLQQALAVSVCYMAVQMPSGDYNIYSSASASSAGTGSNACPDPTPSDSPAFAAPPVPGSGGPGRGARPRDSQPLPGAAVAGIVVGVLLAGGAIGAAVYYRLVKPGRRKAAAKGIMMVSTRRLGLPLDNIAPSGCAVASPAGSAGFSAAVVSVANPTMVLSQRQISLPSDRDGPGLPGSINGTPAPSVGQSNVAVVSPPASSANGAQSRHALSLSLPPVSPTRTAYASMPASLAIRV